MSKTSNVLIVVIIIIVIVLGIWYFISSSAQTAPTQQNAAENNGQNNQNAVTPPVPSEGTPTPTTGTPAPATPASVSVSIQSFAFGPSTLNIKKGTKVTWTNNDSVPHTVTSDSGSLLNSGTIPPGGSFSFTFTNTGSTGYHCTVHPMMKGSVVVN